MKKSKSVGMTRFALVRGGGRSKLLRCLDAKRHSRLSEVLRHYGTKCLCKEVSRLVSEEELCHPELVSGSRNYIKSTPSRICNAHQYSLTNSTLLRGERENNVKHLLNYINGLKDLTTCCPNVFKKAAFTLAEMMVVMLIMTIVLAAAAPVMTTRMKQQQAIGSGSSSIWQWVSSTKDHAYFGEGDAQMALIGQDEVAEGDSAKLIINRVDGGPTNHILFKQDGNTTARLRVVNDSVLLNTGIENPIGAVAIGEGAGEEYEGNGYIAIGNDALKYGKQQANYANIAIGLHALMGKADTPEGDRTGHSNLAIGMNALQNNTKGYQNIAIGDGALYLNTTGGNNIAIGSEALFNNTEKSDNFAIGYQVLKNNQRGSGNLAIGNYALSKNEGYKYEDGNLNRYLYDGSYNTAIGHYALKNSYGSHNTAVGYEALLTPEIVNVREHSPIGGNTAVGYQALRSPYRTRDNWSGEGILEKLEGSENTAIGYQVMAAAEKMIGVANTAVGSQALYYQESGNNNTAIGYKALMNLKSGSNNVAVGYKACENVSGSKKTCIGYNSGPVAGLAWASADDTVERIFIGSKPNFKFSDGTKPTNMIAPLEVHNSAHSSWDNTATVVINGNLIVRGVIEAGVRRESTGDIWKPGLFQYSAASGDDIEYNGDMHLTISDLRLKNVGSEITTGLDKIKQLKVFNYTFKKDKEKTPRVGVIAQDLQKVFPDAVTKGEDGYLRIRTEDMFYAMVNAIKELDAKIAVILNEAKNLKVEFTAFNQAMKQVQNDNNRLKKENKELKSKIQSLEKRLEAIETKLK